jgi:hypothetical protein
MKGGGQQKETVDTFKEELAHQALEADAMEAALQMQEAEEAEEAVRQAEEEARKAEEEARKAEEAAREAEEAFKKRLDEDAKYAAQELSKWHEYNNKSSCTILGGRIKNTFRKKNKSNKNKSKRVNKRIKKNKRNSRKYSRKSLKK